jgi:uncharacterized protein (TIGR00288 family)
VNPWWLRLPTDESTNIEPDRDSDKSEPDQRQRTPPPPPRDSITAGGNGKGGRPEGSNGRRRRRRSGNSAPPPEKKVHNHRIGLFCDIEDIASSLREADSRNFDLEMVLQALAQRGSLVVKRAYADWERFRDLKLRFHEAGFELVDIPRKDHSGKSSADIKLAVDAIELSFSKHHIDTFAILSGEADLSPLVSKLRENGKLVIGIGTEGSASKTLVDCCNEYLFCGEIAPQQAKPEFAHGLDRRRVEAFSLMEEAIRALMEENKDPIWGSMIKQWIQRKQPSFSESAYGYSAFSDLLQDAETCNIISLERDDRSGSYLVKGFRKP